MEINRWLHLLTSLWEILLCCDLFRKNRSEKFPCIAATISCSMHCKINFSSELIDIPEKPKQGKKTNSKAIAKCYASQANTKMDKSEFLTKYIRIIVTIIFM